MGVKGLWRLLLPIGRRVSIEVLEGKILAIDASIWLAQFVNAMRDPDTGSVKPAAHLIGFFRRLAKLRFHGIRPVLVFDGPTPIIKLRELQLRRQKREKFAPDSNGSIQRLAKRLLIQEIKKSKRNSSAKTESSAPGFNLPDEEKQGGQSDADDSGSEDDIVIEQVVAAKEDNEMVLERVVPGSQDLSEQVARALQEEEWRQGDKRGREVLESSEAMARAIQEEEWDDESQDDQVNHRESDWDRPILLEQDDDDTEPKQKKKRIDDHFGNHLLDIERVSSLPSHARKDAIEEAQRRQRIRSRKEFMPVAGQPVEYSQAQLRNFLRSAKLNKDIVEMAKNAAEKDSLPGEQIASDPSRRIVFEKFDSKSTPQRRIARLKPDDDGRDSKDSDSEIEWEDGQGDSAARAKRQTNFLEDSSDDEGPNSINILDSQTPKLENDTGEVAKASGGLISLPTEDDTSSEGGGFLRTTTSDMTTLKQKITDDDMSAAPSDDSFGRGGFLKEDVPEKSLPHEEQETRKPGAINEWPPVDDDDDNIKWEDGDEELTSGPATIVAQDVFHRPPHDSGEDVEWENGDEHFRDAEKSHNSSPNGLREERFSDANAVALQQAQSTAANLTNWAGRAFRLAIAQHEQNGSPFKAIALHRPQVVSTEKRSEEVDKGYDQVILNNRRYAEKAQSVIEINDASDTGREVIASREQGTEEQTASGSGFSTGTTRVGRFAVDKGPESTGSNVKRPAREIASFASEDLFAQEEYLDQEQRHQDRDLDTVTDEMKSEIINLIQLFGIPYVNAVAEAEAQCAALEELGLVDGIVTEDSDVFVFGGKTVYKNMFDDQKYVEIYKANDAAKEMSLGRNQMVALAMLLGGDYTEGVKGVGIVNAMEVLQAFDMSKGVKPGLLEFRKWLDGFDPSDADSRSSSMDTGSLSGIQKFHASHKSARARWEMPSNFPADHILNAYLNPVVDKSTQRFSWGVPDVDNLVHFCARNIGWEASETKRMLDPIMKRLQNGMRQTRLDVFMNYSDNIQFADIRSKRLQSVFKDIQKDQQNESTEE